MSFINDIQGQNTQLYPIVTIEPPSEQSAYGGLEKCIFLSTNSVTLDHIHSGIGNTGESRLLGIYFKPLLLNIPSIKESIDVESRRFKISSVSLSIANYEYEGKRFTDILSDTSLLNWKVSIQFVSPSAKMFSTIYSTHTATNWDNHSLYELYVPPYGTEDAIAYAEENMTKMVYQGVIRRISHDDEKVNVQLEDLTEKKAHKNIPSTFIPDLQPLPENKRDKEIPIVYGEVDRSPVVLSLYDETDLESEYCLKVDSNPIMGYVGKDPLLINQNGIYVNVMEDAKKPKYTAAAGISNSGETSFGYSDPSQYEIINDEIIFKVNSTDYSDEESNVLGNPLGAGFLVTSQIERPSSIEALQYESEGIFFGETSNAQSARNVYYSYIDSPLTENNGFRIRGALAVGSNWAPTLALWDGDVPADADAGMWGDFFYPHLASTGDILDRGLVGCFIKMPSFAKFDDNQGYIFSNFWASFYDRVFLRDTADDIDLKVRFGGASYADYDGDNGYMDFDNQQLAGTESAPNGLDEGATNAPPTHNSLSGTNNPIEIKFVDKLHFYIGQKSSEFAVSVGQVEFYDHIEVHNQGLVEDFLTQDFYANVKGRTNTYNDHPLNVIGSDDIGQALVEWTAEGIPAIEHFLENPIDIIYDLVRSELGHHAIDPYDYQEARNAHDGWKFGFTVNKKINSKKLIEDIAKSTKCFPKFTNDGTFGFNTIKDSYTVEDDYANATLIKESEVVSYSFKKTKPEQIYQKVTVSYNKDYAEDSYLAKHSADYVDIFNPPFVAIGDYYGLGDTEPTLEFESDYIRDGSTASQLINFLGTQNANSHLIFNLKLPLKYINLEIGSLIKFEELLGGKAFGIDYRMISGLGEILLFGDGAGGYAQYAYPLFIITSITKNLDSVSIECMQLHHLWLSYWVDPTGEMSVDESWFDGTSEGDTEGLFYFPDSDPIAISDVDVTPFVVTPPVITLSDGNSITSPISINTVEEGTAINLDTIKAIDGDRDSTDISNDIIVTTSLGQSFSGGGSHFLGDFGVQYSEPQQIFVTYSVISPTSGLPSFTIHQIINLDLEEMDTILTISPKDEYSQNFEALQGLHEFTHYVPLEGNNGIDYFEKYVYNTSDDAEIDYSATDANEGDLTNSVIFGSIEHAEDMPQDWAFQIGLDVFGLAQAHFDTSSETEKVFQCVAAVVDSSGRFSQRYWYVVVTFPPSTLLGDVNQDDAVNVLDVVTLSQFIIHGEGSTFTIPTGQGLINADVNQDDAIDVLDIVNIANLILGND